MPGRILMSRLSTKSQTVIPKEVRQALGVGPGDALLYEVAGDRVVLTKARSPTSDDDPFACFSEWDSENDRKAYASL
jgi:antitoxin PrlF